MHSREYVRLVLATAIRGVKVLHRGKEQSCGRGNERESSPGAQSSSASRCSITISVLVLPVLRFRHDWTSSDMLGQTVCLTLTANDSVALKTSYLFRFVFSFFSPKRISSIVVARSLCSVSLSTWNEVALAFAFKLYEVSDSRSFSFAFWLKRTQKSTGDYPFVFSWDILSFYRVSCFPDTLRWTKVAYSLTEITFSTFQSRHCRREHRTLATSHLQVLNHSQLLIVRKK